MTALLILNYDVVDAERLAAYRVAAAPALLGPDAGELVSSTDRTLHLAEAPEGGTHTVVLRFRDVEHARSVYASDAYRAHLGARLAATTPHSAFVVPEGS
ncbi:DUF1330 domain-containing protein [Streptomyces heilongjiangensis]|uniref:DUF1330 domain-containing protein n=1 Tax=Streptomyces heilongjiangensis TaxID=945052 RepID=A0ABW1AYN4_9ACTN|nr:DUF1330 domain-containing protein [Streptomyces heilongjiangensis]MDC2947922.1 DUF1330 domain-containing protein [Streptomyces heilongjiangensis]